MQKFRKEKSRLHVSCSAFTGSVAAVGLALLALGLGVGRAAGAASADSLTFSESYAEKLLSTRTTPVTCTKVGADKFTATGGITLTPAAVAALDGTTVFRMRVGSATISHALGDDPNYSHGKTSATFVDTFPLTGGQPATQTTQLKWKGTRLTASIRGSATDVSAAGWSSIVASGYAGHAAGAVTEAISATIAVGDTGFSFSLPASGKVAVQHVNGKDGRAYSLAKISFRTSGSGNASALILPVHVTKGSSTALTSATLGNAGGTLNVSSGSLAGLSVSVPPGALDAAMQMMLSKTSVSLTPRSGTFPGDAISIETTGQTTFHEPLRVTIPFGGAGNTIAVPYHVNAKGNLVPCQIVGFDRVHHTLSFETFHASLFTWLFAPATGTGGHTKYLPNTDGFQIVNNGSSYNPAGECFGMSAFAQWFYAEKGGGLYPKYMQDIPVPGGGTVKGQNIIATRAHTSVSRLWNSYLPQVARQQDLTGAERLAWIVNVLDNTAYPTLLYLWSDNGAHAVLAYDHDDSNNLAISDPNYPGAARTGGLSAGSLVYQEWPNVIGVGNGSFHTEPFDNIYADAQSGFSGNGAAQVTVASPAAGAHVTARTITLTGQVESGQVLVDHLTVWLNGSAEFSRDIGLDGTFAIPINLATGGNKLSFQTSGHDADGNQINVPNTQLAPFVINCDAMASAILVTLTWNTDDTDLDLYTIDPSGDYSAYYHPLTADGGELDYDDTTGYGPEHWTLGGTDTVRWGQPYTVRVHYYSDHGNGGSGTLASRWNVSVMLYEGTSRAVTYNYSGVLSYDNAPNDDPQGTGADWADVCTVVPVAAGAGPAAPRVQTVGGIPRILVPIPSAAEKLEIKTAAEK